MPSLRVALASEQATREELAKVRHAAEADRARALMFSRDERIAMLAYERTAAALSELAAECDALAHAHAELEARRLSLGGALLKARRALRDARRDAVASVLHVVSSQAEADRIGGHYASPVANAKPSPAQHDSRAP